MKNEYITPATIVAEIELGNMLATSLGVGENIENPDDIGAREEAIFPGNEMWEW